jgi:hypothetical protein
MLVSASDHATSVSSGSINTSVNASDEAGFACASGSAGRFLLEDMPKFFASRLATMGLLRSENSGKYRIALVLDERSRLVSYTVGSGTSEYASVVQAIIRTKHFPALPANAACVAGKAFLYELALE